MAAAAPKRALIPQNCVGRRFRLFNGNTIIRLPTPRAKAKLITLSLRPLTLSGFRRGATLRMKTVYTSPYANNLSQMHNSEITGLAKNRFTDEDTMLAISKHHYRLGKEYLASNPNLTPEAAKELYDHRGYVFKSLLLSSGKIKLKKKEYAEVYRKYFKNNGRSHWRMMQAFFGGYGYWHREKNENNTPRALLDEIYEDLGEDETRHSYTLERFINHQNCSLNLALRISTMPDPPNLQNYYHTNFADLRQKALLKVAEITKREGVDAR